MNNYKAYWFKIATCKVCLKKSKVNVDREREMFDARRTFDR